MFSLKIECTFQQVLYSNGEYRIIEEYVREGGGVCKFVSFIFVYIYIVAFVLACDVNCLLCDRNEDCLQCQPDHCYDSTEKVCRGKQKINMK